MKLAVLGGGGVRSMFLAKSITQRAKELNIDEIVFMDTNEEKLNIFGKMAQEVAKRIDKDILFTLTTDIIIAVKNAKYIITTIRVGGDLKRIDDESIALNNNVIGQETTGAAGFSFAMRSVPVLARYCDLIKKYSQEDVKVFNFTNPAGVVSQTLRDMGYEFTYGICDAPSGLLNDFAKIYNVSPSSIVGECFGLNHLSFFNSIKIDGKEYLEDIINNSRIYEESEMRYFDKNITKHFGYIINEYLYYFFYREQALNNILTSPKTRGHLINDVNIGLIEELKQYNISKDFDVCLKIFEKWYNKRESAYMKNETGITKEKKPFRFDIYSPDLGGYAGVALNFIKAIETKKSINMIICVPNNGSIKDLEDSDVVEITCTIENNDVINHRFLNLNETLLALIKKVKTYERLASKAIREKDKQTAIDCLFSHPLFNSYSIATKLVNEYLDSNKEYINGWE
jgi:6-phospho-beta-glucosidase